MHWLLLQSLRWEGVCIYNVSGRCAFSLCRSVVNVSSLMALSWNETKKLHAAVSEENTRQITHRLHALRNLPDAAALQMHALEKILTKVESLEVSCSLLNASECCMCMRHHCFVPFAHGFAVCMHTLGHSMQRSCCVRMEIGSSPYVQSPSCMIQLERMSFMLFECYLQLDALCKVSAMPGVLEAI